jgi:hypothetical protein
MKKLILVVVVSIFMIQVQAQKLITKDVPAAITTAFAKANPTILDAEWSKAGNDFAAQFTVKNLPTTATYDASGKLLNTVEIILATELPVPTIEYVKKNYKVEEVEKVSKITNANNVVSYLVKVKGIDLTFDLMGDFIR